MCAKTLCQNIHISDVTFFIAMISVCSALSCASTGAIAAASANVISSKRFPFAMGTASVTNAGTCRLRAPPFSRVTSPKSISTGTLHALRLSFLGLLSAVFFAVLAWPPLLPRFAEKLLLFLSSSDLLLAPISGLPAPVVVSALERRAQEAREKERRAQEAREEERRAQEAREEERRAQEAREEQERAQEAREESAGGARGAGESAGGAKRS